MTRVADLRIRLEGRLETVEDGSAALAGLLRFADPRRWQEEPALLLSRLDAWHALQPQLEEALKHVRQQPELASVVRQHAALRARLSGRLAWHHQPLSREHGFEARLKRWHEVVAPFVLSGRAPPRLEGWARQRDTHLFKSLAAVIIVALSPLPATAAAVAALLAYLGLFAGMWPTRWRLYDDCLELEERGRAPIRIPLASLTRAEHVATTLELDGLYRVTLISDEMRGLAALALELDPSSNLGPAVIEG